MSTRPETTLFLLVSVDGKISTGDTDEMDVDKDFPRIDGVREGLQQYYDLEKTTDLFSLNSGRVLEKIGVNEKKENPPKTSVTFIVIDNKPHLKESGVRFMAAKAGKLVIVTANPNHPAISLKDELLNIEVLAYKDEIDFQDMFQKLKSDFGAERVTIQTGGTLNAVFVREGLVDHLSLVVAPALIGGSDTSSLMDGESLHKEDELFKIKPLILKSATPLEHNYLHLQYGVVNG